MDYFRILNLKKEPFSNSPEPEFFFQSVKHVGCLQKLELAIRLRRGLSVVIGDVGTGKTTLCRQLILKFASSEEDRNQMETHLIMDPSFTNALEFLLTVAVTFGLSGADINISEWQLKENIKNYLFGKGVDEGKIVVLIIDEGQKLPDYCLEILREFLNYETNEYKLLQIVIFAQSEFEQVIKRHKNFTDRINFYYLLKPLNFRETKGMVKFRIAKASATDRAVSLFTYPGLWALYLATKGYPRKIVTLCHQIMLALIIQNRPKAGWFLVRSCAQRIPAGRRKILKWVTASTLAVIFGIIAMAGFSPEKILGIRPENESLSTIKTQEISSSGQTESIDSDHSTKPPVKEVATTQNEIQRQKKIPDLLGKLTLKKGRTVWWVLYDFYGYFNSEQLKAVALANPHIKDLNRVNAGEAIKLPAIPAESKPLQPGKLWVQIANSENIDEIYELYKNYEFSSPSLRFLPYWNRKEGLVFAIFLKDGYPDMESALDVVKKLPQPLASSAKVLAILEDDTIFFAR
jgi:general secretion pathway protein A